MVESPAFLAEVAHNMSPLFLDPPQKAERQGIPKISCGGGALEDTTSLVKSRCLFYHHLDTIGAAAAVVQIFWSPGPLSKYATTIQSLLSGNLI